jgi:hypothetical protein
MPDSVPSIGPRQILILGLTLDGKVFRPSDWAERLAGVMSQFRPGAGLPGTHLGYSPWCSPGTRGQVKCVIAHKDLREHEPMAWDFLVNFARDNSLRLVDGDLATAGTATRP